MDKADRLSTAITHTISTDVVLNIIKVLLKS